MKRTFLSILVTGILLLSACGAPTTAPPAEAPPTEQQTYTLSVSISPSRAGSVSPSSGEYESGVQVTLTATPTSGYTFDYWDGDASGSSATITITMDLDKTVIAHFADTIAPVISGVDISGITESSVTISWVTDEPATSQVEYGTTDAYGSTMSLDEELTTSHRVSLRGLEPNTTYHFRVKSEDEAANEALSGDYTFVTSKPATEVGGIISSNTIWTEENSPYVITSTVQIPAGVKLTIEPGVTVTMPSNGDMFLLHGTISARGTTNKKIIFDGGDNSDIFTTLGGAGNADLDYSVIRNGHKFWDGGGHFRLTYSELANLTRVSGNPNSRACVGLESPSADIYIEYNRFINTGGIWAYQARGKSVKIYIRHNLFQETSSPISHAGGSPGLNEMIVKYNSFIDIAGLVLSLEPDFESTNMNATENYWGTLDTDIIDQKIYDKNDDIRVKNYIDYLPILTSPHPSTPTP